jgi:hypothetical protein
VGIETYPSPTIGTNRKSNISPCFRESVLAASIADYRRAAANCDGISGFWCIDGLDLEFAPLLRGGADENPHFTRRDLSEASLFS